MTKAKSKSKLAGREFLQDAFALEQRVLQAKLALSTQSVTHPGVLGDVNEGHFVEALRKYLPRRYAVDTGIVIDGLGNTSDQIDVIVYDNQYTPTLLDQEDHRFVPVEAVYAVFEVKPTINKPYLEYAGHKARSVRTLVRTSVPIVHAGGEYPAKPLFAIVAGIVAGDVAWRTGFNSKAFRGVLNSLKGEQKLDAGLAVSGSSFDSYDGSVVVGPSKQALAYFLFRLLQKLQSLGTVPAVDWTAYGKALANKVT